jgi:hypothetical protein
MNYDQQIEKMYHPENFMSKEEFEALTGENPEDVLGPDWQNIVEDFQQREAEVEYERLKRHLKK